jgi:hypothetical protein
MSPIGDILPSSESQLRPLLNGLQNDSERVHVWENVKADGELGIAQQTVSDILVVPENCANAQKTDNQQVKGFEVQWYENVR